MANTTLTFIRYAPYSFALQSHVRSAPHRCARADRIRSGAWHASDRANGSGRDQPAAAGYQAATDAPIKFGDWAWNETKAPLTGPVLVTVDIKSQTLSVFRDGHQIGMTRMIYGDDNKPTPIGVFPIIEKDEKHRSSIFVNAPMPYMLRMTGDGISVHGADKVEPIYATNGCIGIPNGFAKRLFGVVAPGDRIVVTKATDLKPGDVVGTAPKA
jgi:L,D-transpeptidase catalytic domain